MWNPFKKTEPQKEETPWTYGFGIDNIPDNEHLISYTSVNSPEFVISANQPLPRKGEEIIIKDDYYNMIYSCRVTDICYNYPLHWISIQCDCFELKIKKNDEKS